MAFAHLHTHSEYSLLDGANRIADLVATVKTQGADTLAITDHGNLHCAVSFHRQARAQQIRPILGFEAYLAYGSRHRREKSTDAPADYSHLVLLAKNQQGYRNLIKLSSLGYLEGFYRRPRIDRELLEQYTDGLICLSACLSGEVAHWLRRDNYERAKASAAYFARIFGPDGFWLEVQNHGIADEKIVANGVFELSQDLGVPVVVTNDAHYLRREDADVHDVLLCIGTGKELDDPNRFRFTGQESYLKSEEEMLLLFPEHPEIVAETMRVADLCEFDISKQYCHPQYPLPESYATPEDLLVSLATEGAQKRFGDPLPADVQERFDYELGVITKTGYSSYLLIVADFIQAARDRGIPVGPGRGSAAGSLVAYALGITSVNPLQFDLLFERFLNPDRISMPDIDVDFCFERRGEVIEYVRERYGRDSVGQIITFGRLKARAAVRDVARVLKIDLAETDRIAKLMPSGPGASLSLAEAAASIPEVKSLMQQDERIAKVIQYGSTIEGLARHASVHAAGIVVAPGPLTDYVPVCTAPGAPDAAITQFDMNDLEDVGMLKMDFLGLKTLTAIHDAVEIIQHRHGVELDVDDLDLEDAATYALLRDGRTAGVFQFESALATDTLRNMRCDSFDDLVATNALLRPGPLDSGMHHVFIRRKLGKEVVKYPHPDLEKVLKPTYGVITYQEQVMRIANILAGFTLAEADVLRKAVGKKKQELIQQELGKFIERAVARNHDRRVIEDIAAQIETFGRYGFNKSHSVAYSMIAYQTAWLKTHYPAEFMAALLSSEIGDTDKVVQYINEARELELEVLPPDINESGYKFTVVGDQRIRFGLGAVKGVGRGAIESVIAGRDHGGPYRSLYDFCDRIDLRLCNKRVVDALIFAGACDGLDGHRAQLAVALEIALSEAQLRQRDRASGQESLFGDGSDSNISAEQHADLPNVPLLPEAERLAREKAVVGFFISGHPLERFRDEVHLFGTRTTATAGEWAAHPVNVAAVVTAVRRQTSRRSGAEYARVTLEDFQGTAETIVFPDTWAKLRSTIQVDQALLITGGYSQRDRDEEQATLIVEEARPLAGLRAAGQIGLELRWTAGSGVDPDATRAAAALCSAYPGPAPVYILWSDGNGTTARFLAKRIRVDVTAELLHELRSLLGEQQVQLVKAD